MDTTRCRSNSPSSWGVCDVTRGYQAERLKYGCRSRGSNDLSRETYFGTPSSGGIHDFRYLCRSRPTCTSGLQCLLPYELCRSRNTNPLCLIYGSTKSPPPRPTSPAGHPRTGRSRPPPWTSRERRAGITSRDRDHYCDEAQPQGPGRNGERSWNRG